MFKKTLLIIIASIIIAVLGDWFYQSRNIAPEQACNISGGTFDGKGCLGSKEVTLCQPSQRQGDVCFALYDPVCAKVNIQCVTIPCDPVNQTFSNPCEACRNPLVESYTNGECAN